MLHLHVGDFLEPDYLLACFPLLAMLLGTPLVEETNVGRLLFERPTFWTPREFRSHLQDFKLSERSLREGQYWTLLSHIFLHEDRTHLFHNVQNFLLYSWQVYNDTKGASGCLGVYGVFLSTAVLSALNREGRSRQTQKQLEGSMPRMPESIGPVSMPEFARNAWDSVREKTAIHAAPIVVERTEFYGASGGVCGLMGYTTGSILISLASRGGADRAARSQSGIQDGLKLLSLVNAISWLLPEWQAAEGSEGMTGIDHVGHLTGFFAGLVVAIFVHWDKLDDGSGPRRSSGRRFISANGHISYD